MELTIRPLEARDLPDADRIFRLAFGTFIGLPDPLSFAGDADLVHGRWRAAPTAALGAYLDNELIGSNFAAHWGSFGFFGPLTVRPDFWDKGVAKHLLTATMDLFARWGTRQEGLFTFPHSPKHLTLYQKFGFWPQALTPVMARAVESTKPASRWAIFSQVAVPDREACLIGCREITNALYPGLDVLSEIEAVANQKLGDTALLYDGEELVGFAICHMGAGSEAGTGTVYIKFGAVRPGPSAAKLFEDLLAACEALAAENSLTRLVAGTNTARHEAYRIMLERGFRPFISGVAMQRPNDPGYNRPDCFVVDDWR